MSTLREAAQAVVENWGRRADMWEAGDLIDRLRAALAQPEPRKVCAWAVLCDGDTVDTRLTETAANLIAENRREQNRGKDLDFEVRPLYAHPTRDEWREAVHDELVTTWTFTDKNKNDPRLALRDIINWHVRASLNPDISSDARALIEQGKAMRDGWRLASEPPEDGRLVIAWCEGRAHVALHMPDTDPHWYQCPGPDNEDWYDLNDVTHWRDVTLPMEGEP